MNRCAICAYIHVAALAHEHTPMALVSQQQLSLLFLYLAFILPLYVSYFYTSFAFRYPIISNSTRPFTIFKTVFTIENIFGVLAGGRKYAPPEAGMADFPRGFNAPER